MYTNRNQKCASKGTAVSSTTTYCWSILLHYLFIRLKSFESENYHSITFKFIVIPSNHITIMQSRLRLTHQPPWQAKITGACGGFAFNRFLMAVKVLSINVKISLKQIKR